jgi:DNA-binding Lrp family transcriptional regulator
MGGINDMTPDEIMAELDKLADFPKPPPEHAFTIYDAADKYGLSFEQMKRRLNQLVKDGRLEKWPHVWERKTWYYLQCGDNSE